MVYVGGQGDGVYYGTRWSCLVSRPLVLIDTPHTCPTNIYVKIDASDSSTDARIQEFAPVWRAEGLTFGWGEEEEGKGKKGKANKERWWSRWVFLGCVYILCG